MILNDGQAVHHSRCRAAFLGMTTVPIVTNPTQVASSHWPGFCSGPDTYQLCINSITASTGSQGNWYLSEIQKQHTIDKRAVAAVTKADFSLTLKYPASGPLSYQKPSN